MRVQLSLLVLAAVLVLSWGAMDLAGWAVGLEALTGTTPSGGAGMVARGIAYGLGWIGASALAPILAATALLWAVFRKKAA